MLTSCKLVEEDDTLKTIDDFVSPDFDDITAAINNVIDVLRKDSEILIDHLKNSTRPNNYLKYNKQLQRKILYFKSLSNLYDLSQSMKRELASLINLDDNDYEPNSISQLETLDDLINELWTQKINK